MRKDEQRIIEIVCKIVNPGSNAEIIKNKDGTWNVYEVKKSIKCVG